MLSTANAVATAYDAVAERYDGIYETQSCKEEDILVHGLLKHHLGGVPAGTTLDVGCGTGALLDHLPLFNPDDYVGMDISREMLKVARRKHPDHMFVQGDVLDTTGFSKYDNVVSMWGSLTYVPLDGAFQAVDLSLCRDHGRFFIMTFGPAYSPVDIKDELVPRRTALEIAQVAQLSPNLKLQRLVGLTSTNDSGVRLVHHELENAEHLIAMGVSR